MPRTSVMLLRLNALQGDPRLEKAQAAFMLWVELEATEAWRSAAGMLSGKKSIQAVSTNKKGGPTKAVSVRKSDGVAPLKVLMSVESEDTESAEGMKIICHELTIVSNDPDISVNEDLVKETDRLVSCLATMVPRTLNFNFSGASSRSCKYVLNTLMQESTLDNLVSELLLRLLNERVPLMDEGSQLLKALDVLVLKILDNAERTSSFVVLIRLLRPLDPSRWPSTASSEALATRNQKFSDVVVKCLIKLSGTPEHSR